MQVSMKIVPDEEIPSWGPVYDVVSKVVSCEGECYVFAMDFAITSSDSFVLYATGAASIGPRWWKVTCDRAQTYNLVFKTPGRIMGLLQPPSSGVISFVNTSEEWATYVNQNLKSFSLNSDGALVPFPTTPLVAMPSLAAITTAAAVLQKQANAQGLAGLNVLGTAGLALAIDPYCLLSYWSGVGQSYGQQNAATFNPRNNLTAPMFIGARFTNGSATRTILFGDVNVAQAQANARVPILFSIKRPSAAWLLQDINYWLPSAEDSTGAVTYRFCSIAGGLWTGSPLSVATPGGPGIGSSGLGSAYGLSGAPSPSNAPQVALS